MTSAESSTKRHALLVSLVVLFAFGLALAPTSGTAGNIESGKADLAVKELGAYTKPVSSTNSLGKKLESIEVGGSVWLSCLWEARPRPFNKFVVTGDLQFAASIAVNGQPFHHGTGTIGSMFDWKESHALGAIGPARWTPRTTGRFSIGCNVDATNVLSESPDLRGNNQRIETITVWRHVSPTDNLAVSFPSVTPGQRLVYNADLRVPLQVSVSADFFSLVDQGVVSEPSVKYEIRYHGPDREARTFGHTAKLRAKPAETEFNHSWFAKRDLAAGRYEVTARIVGGRLPDIVEGPVASTSFHLVPPDMSARQGRGAPASPNPGTLQSATAATGTAAPTTLPPRTMPVASAAPPNPCGIDVTYYVPQSPVVRSVSGDVQSKDQVSIRCDFKAVTGRLEWPDCDAGAERAMGILRLAKESGSRYSGMLVIDGQNVGVGTSPVNGGDFSTEKTWSYKEAGNHEISCRIDNGLQYAVKDGVDRLIQTISHNVGMAEDLREYMPLDMNALKSVAVERLLEQIAPLPDGAAARLRVAGAAGFDPMTQYSGVETASGAVALSDDLNDAENIGSASESSIPGAATVLSQQAAVTANISLPDLAVLSAIAQFRCAGGTPLLVVTGTLENIGAAKFVPPEANTLVSVSTIVNDERLYGRTKLSAVAPGERIQIDVVMNEGEVLPAAVVAGAKYFGEFEANRMHSVNERTLHWNNSRSFTGTLAPVPCRAGRRR